MAKALTLIDEYGPCPECDPRRPAISCLCCGGSGRVYIRTVSREGAKRTLPKTKPGRLN